MWNGPLDGAAMERIMQPFRLSLAGAPFVPRADMLLHRGSWKGPFCSICLKAADLCDNLKTLDVKVSLTHRLLNGFFVLPCDLTVILTWSYEKEESWKLQRGHPGGSSSQMPRTLWRGPDDFNSVESARTRRVEKVGLGSQLVPANVSISTWGMHYSAALIDWADSTREPNVTLSFSGVFIVYKKAWSDPWWGWRVSQSPTLQTCTNEMYGKILQWRIITLRLENHNWTQSLVHFNYSLFKHKPFTASEYSLTWHSGLTWPNIKAWKLYSFQCDKCQQCQ